ncbi:nucleoside-diphosphate kinase [Candidatus Pacearchaeota archaeon]|nr:nucleoside-diphosphate kinase [Candidatus Pacearchaeota archaeon]
MAVQQCLIIIKPDGLVKSLTGNIITSLSETKLKIVGAKIVKVKRELAEKHYAELKNKKPHVFEGTIEYITGKYHTDRVLVLVYHGENAIENIRDIVGPTNPEEAKPTTIRGRYGRIHSKTGIFENVIHSSDSPESAEKEIKLWFSPEELAEIIYPVIKEKISVQRIIWQ